MKLSINENGYYLSLANDDKFRLAANTKQVKSINPKALVNMDYDGDNKLFGIEVICKSKLQIEGIGK